MDFTRRRLLTTTLAASAAVGMPHLWVPGSRDAWGATLKKGEPLKVGVLFSLTGALAVPEEDSTLVLQYAFDEIKSGILIEGSALRRADKLGNHSMYLAE